MILVTGGSGFLGSHLVRALVAAGHPVRAIARSAEAAERVPAGAEVVAGDLDDPESLKAAAAGCHLVYHLAGAYRGSPAEVHGSHVAGTARLLRAVDPEARFVYVSSSSVYGWHQAWPADELTPPRPESAYGKAKLAAERLVLARTSGSAVVVRPTITYGVGDRSGMLARAHALMRRRLRTFPGTGANRIHLTHVDDLTAALVRAGQSGEGVFLVAGPAPTPVRDILRLLADGAGLPAPSFRVPAGLVRSVASAVDSTWSALGRGGEAPLSRHSVEVMTVDRAYAPKRAAAEWGWTPSIGVEEGVPPVGAWLAAEHRPPAPKVSAAAVASGNATSGSEDELGFDWRGYVADEDEGLGTVYERFALRDVLQDAVDRTASRSVLHAPAFGMMGFPGIDCVFLAQAGVRVGLLDFSAERLDAVVKQWRELGLEPDTHLVDGPDPATWPEELGVDYDLVFSFAALWWFDDPWAVLARQAAWADKAVLSCVPNKNVFIRVRAKLWHQGLFDRLNEQALDRQAQVDAARRIGLEPLDTGLFDIPPFPDTSVPLAKVVRALLGKQEAPAGGEGAWRWSILPYLRGEQPDLEERVAKLAAWERYLPRPMAPGLAHHRYTLFTPAST
ncbi:MAG TPA: NAD-dependent epimerase/dehydratase family protein [Acidimicrobiales bacterium]|nr:NAD-dependent epimerase/dehydratase family protein [Acidimicrobiales bacterium]